MRAVDVNAACSRPQSAVFRGRRGAPAAVGAVFWIPAVGASRGCFPAPLDDVYIHFDFARSLGQGHPFEWIPGQGTRRARPRRSTRSCSRSAGWSAFAVARSASGPRSSRPRVASLLLRAAARAAVPAVARVARACSRSRSASSTGRSSAGWRSRCSPLRSAGRWTRSSARAPRRAEARRARPPVALGAWGAALVLLRPEAGVIVGVFAVVAARGGGASLGIAAVLRARSPGSSRRAPCSARTSIATGEPRSAGAQLKLLSSNPYLSDVDRARVFVENILSFAIEGSAASSPRCARSASSSRRSRSVARPRASRAIGAACLLGALGWILLVSWNGNSPFHNFRYYAPALLLVLVAGGWACRDRARARRDGGRARRRRSRSRGDLAAARDARADRGTSRARREHPRSADRGRRAPRAAAARREGAPRRRRRDPVRLGARRNRRARPRRLPGHAVRARSGARRGGHDRAHRAARRPSAHHLALYPNWFGLITSQVRRRDRSRDNRGQRDLRQPDEGDLPRRLERARSPHDAVARPSRRARRRRRHRRGRARYVSPLPHGGWTTLDVLDDDTGARRFDGGRTIPDGRTESFVVQRRPARGRSASSCASTRRAASVLVARRAATVRWRRERARARGARRADVARPRGRAGRARGARRRVRDYQCGSGAHGRRLARSSTRAARRATRRQRRVDRTRREPNRGCASGGPSRGRCSPTSSSPARRGPRAAPTRTISVARLPLAAKHCRSTYAPGGAHRVRPDAGSRSRGAERRRHRRARGRPRSPARRPRSARPRRPGSSARTRYCSRVRARRCRPRRRVRHGWRGRQVGERQDGSRLVIGDGDHSKILDPRTVRASLVPLTAHAALDACHPAPPWTTSATSSGRSARA